MDILAEALDEEIKVGCSRRPTKRMALMLAAILNEQRVHPANLMLALQLIDALRGRIGQAKI